MRIELFWINGPWPGRLAITPRPRGGDWLEAEILAWRQAGIDVVISLLTPDEAIELNLIYEAALCRANGIELVNFPIMDRSIPTSMEAFSGFIAAIDGRLANGKHVAIHCRQSVGRAGLVAVCLLISSGMEQNEALAQVGAARGYSVPETLDQLQWITDFTKSLAAHVPG